MYILYINYVIVFIVPTEDGGQCSVSNNDNDYLFTATPYRYGAYPMSMQSKTSGARSWIFKYNKYRGY
jgi:hypothetical protein